MFQDKFVHILQFIPAHGINLVDLVPEYVHFFLTNKIAGGYLVLVILTANHKDAEFVIKFLLHLIGQYFDMVIQILTAFH